MSVVLPEPLRPDDGDHGVGRDLDGDVLEDRRRLGAAVAESHATEADPSLERLDRDEARAIAALLRLGLEDVVEPVEVDGGVLQVVPERHQRHDRRVGEGHEGVEGHQGADRHLPLHHLVGTHEQEEHHREQGDAVDGAVVAHHHEVGLEALPHDAMELPQHQVAEGVLRAQRLHRLDALDGVDLERLVAPVDFLELGVEREEPRRRVAHEEDEQRYGGEEHQGEHGAVDRHQRDGGEQLGHGGEGRDPVLDDELAHLPDAGEPALDVAGAPGVEVAHRQAQEPPGEEVERRGVDAHRGEREQVSLHHGGAAG